VRTCLVSMAVVAVVLGSGCAARSRLSRTIYTTGPTVPSIPTVKVVAKKSVVDEISRWDKRIWFFTSKSAPVRTLDGLTPDDIAGWGLEICAHIAKFRELATGVKGVQGVHMIGTGNAIFTRANPPRIFITWSGQEKNLTGAARIEFVPAPSKGELAR